MTIMVADFTPRSTHLHPSLGQCAPDAPAGTLVNGARLSWRTGGFPRRAPWGEHSHHPDNFLKKGSQSVYPHRQVV